MNNINMEVEGAQKLFNNLDSIQEDIENELEDIIHKGAEIIKKDAAKKASKTSDKLGKSIEVHTLEITKNKMRIGIGPVGGEVFYWYFVEFGTKHMEANPYLRPAFEQNKREVKKYIAKGINELIKKAGVLDG